MKYIQATESYTNQIVELVQDTINKIYPRYYPKEVVKFFCSIHSKEKINEDIKKGYVWILFKDKALVGTGSYKENHITRVYVSPDFQGNGYGSFIIQKLENKISDKYDKVFLDASLPASQFYEKRGYKTLKHEKCEVQNGSVLVYEIMEKVLHNTKR